MVVKTFKLVDRIMWQKHAVKIKQNKQMETRWVHNWEVRLDSLSFM